MSAARMQVLSGVSASPGVADGRALIYRDELPPIERGPVAPEQVEDELDRFDAALARSRAELSTIRRKVENALGSDQAGLYEASLMILDDPEVRDAVARGVTQERHTAAWAYHRTMEDSAARLAAATDEYLADRACDFKAVARRVLHHLLGGRAATAERLAEPMVLIARTLEPATLFALDPARVLGLATDGDGPTSHLAILARSLGMPAVVGLRNLCSVVSDDDHVVVDGDRGTVTIGPDAEVIKSVRRRRAVRAKRDRALSYLRDVAAVTPDGRVIGLRANIETPEEVAHAIEVGAEGVGLYRTEYLAIGRGGIPSEAVQYHTYRRVLEAMAPRPVTIRTFDMGGDKFSHEDVPEEANPFLGWRSLRVSLDRPEEFRTQLRAILRAGVAGNLEIMFPFVTDAKDVVRAKEQLAEAEAELDARGVERCADYKVGAMMEVPSACITADRIVREVDFVSIGTNDLTQYVLAVDRVNPTVAGRYEPLQPAVLRLVKIVADAGRAAGVRVGVCGELAAYPEAAPLLLGLGLTDWSMAPGFIPAVKDVIRSTEYAASVKLAEECLSADDAREVMRLLRGAAVERKTNEPANREK